MAASNSVLVLETLYCLVCFKLVCLAVVNNNIIHVEEYNDSFVDQATQLMWDYFEALVNKGRGKFFLP
jgi:hypothetical protein